MNTDLLYAIATIATCIAFILAVRYRKQVTSAAILALAVLVTPALWFFAGLFIILAAILDVMLRIKRLIKRKKQKDFEGLRYEEILGI